VETSQRLCRQDRSADEDERGSWVPSDKSCSVKQEKQHYKYKISAESPLHREVSKTCKKEIGSMADNTILA
jgi:hypothetical protein